MKINKNSLILEENELISLEIMLEDLPYYLSLDNTQLSAITSYERKNILKAIKKIFKNHKDKTSKEMK